jgi:hypothetical protein
MKSNIGDSYSKNGDLIINKKMEIARCFYSNTVEEIMENLRKENTPFA